jgi:hypothetical protein
MSRILIHNAIRCDNEAEFKQWLNHVSPSPTSSTASSASSLLTPSESSVDVLDSSRQTPLHVAASENRVSMVKRLIKKKANVNMSDVKGWSPLHCAALNGNFAICDLLLSHKADPLAATSHGCSVAYYLARYCGDASSVSEQVKLLRRLKDAGDDFSLRCVKSNTTQHNTTQHNTTQHNTTQHKERGTYNNDTDDRCSCLVAQPSSGTTEQD